MRRVWCIGVALLTGVVAAHAQTAADGAPVALNATETPTIPTPSPAPERAAVPAPAVDIKLRHAGGLNAQDLAPAPRQTAQEVVRPTAMSLIEVFTAANKGAPSVEAAKAGSDAATYGLHDAYFGFLPRAQVTFSKQREEQQVLRTDNPVYQTGRGWFSNSDRTLQVVQPILDGRLFAQLEGAYAVRNRAGYELTLAGQKIIDDTIESYLLGLAALDDLHLAQEEVRVLENHSNDLKQRLARGLGNDAELHDLTARLEKARADVFAADSNFDKALADLRKVSGVVVPNLYPLRTDFGMPPPEPNNQDDWVAAAGRRNPELAALRAGADAAEADYHKAIGAVLPRVDLFATDDRLDAGGSLFGGGALTDQRTFEIRLTVPLFNADGQGYPLFQMAAKARQQRYSGLDRQRDVETKVRAAFIQSASNAKRSQALLASMKSRDQFTDDLNKRFNAGVGSFSDVLDAERDAFRARRELLSSHYNYLVSMMQLKYYAGAINGDDIVFINGLLDIPPGGVHASPRS